MSEEGGRKGGRPDFDLDLTTPNRRLGKRDTKMDPMFTIFRVSFGNILGSISGPESCPTQGPNVTKMEPILEPLPLPLRGRHVVGRSSFL